MINIILALCENFSSKWAIDPGVCGTVFCSIHSLSSGNPCTHSDTHTHTLLTHKHTQFFNVWHHPKLHRRCLLQMGSLHICGSWACRTPQHQAPPPLLPPPLAPPLQPPHSNLTGHQESGMVGVRAWQLVPPPGPSTHPPSECRCPPFAQGSRRHFHRGWSLLGSGAGWARLVPRLSPHHHTMDYQTSEDMLQADQSRPLPCPSLRACENINANEDRVDSVIESR